MTPKDWPENVYYKLIDCVINNELDVVRALIPQCDCRQENSYLLQLASCHGHREMFDLLYPFSDSYAALEDLVADNAKDIAQGSYPAEYGFGETLLRERLAMAELHKNLTVATGVNDLPLRLRKI